MGKNKTLILLIIIIIIFPHTLKISDRIDNSQEIKRNLLIDDTIELLGINTFPNSDNGNQIGDYFTLNMGQVPFSDVIFHSRNAYFTTNGIIFRYFDKSNFDFRDSINKESFSHEPEQMEIYKLNFNGANNIVPYGEKKLSHKSNFFFGSTLAEWRSDVPNYEELVYENLYDNIDLKYYFQGNGMKYEFIVHPGGNLDNIQMEYDGVSLNTDGSNLFIKGELATVIDKDLYIYQIIDERIKPIDGKLLLKENIVSFDITYNKQHTLVIDPLIFSTLIGGNDFDQVYEMKLDPDDNIIVTGTTRSTNFPTTPGVYAPNYGGGWNDIFLYKLNENGSTLNFSTYIGGSRSDNCKDVFIDQNGSIYICGNTDSTNYPTSPNAYCKTYSGGIAQRWDIVVSKINNNGSKILYSTYIGTSGHEHATGIEVDSTGNAFITGDGDPNEFPLTSNAFNNSRNGDESRVIVVKLNNNGTDLIYSTFIGIGWGEDIAIDPSGNAYIVGYTYSTNFPTTINALNRTINGYADGFITKLNRTGSGLIYSTFIGGIEMDVCSKIKIDSQGNAFVTGSTESVNFPNTTGAFDNSHNGGQFDGFILKLNNSGSSLDYSTYIGGNARERIWDICLDNLGRAYITGSTNSSDYPSTKDAYDPTYNASNDVILSVLNENGSGLYYSTFIGNKYSETGLAVAVDASGYIVIAGGTNGTDFPLTEGANDTTPNGDSDNFILKFGIDFVPSKPTGLTANSGNKFINISWNLPLKEKYPIINYKIYRGLNESTMVFYKLLGNITSFNDSNVKNGVVYYYAISALNTNGEGLISTIINATPGAPPSNPEIFSDEAGDGFIAFSWYPPVDTKDMEIINYRIYRGLIPSNLNLLITILNITDYNDTTVVNGIRYYYAVTAINIKGESNRSNIIDKIPGTVPTPPKNLRTIEGNNFITLLWDAPADNKGFPIMNYWIYRGKNSLNINKYFLNNNTLEFTDINVKNGNIYFYYVTAVNIEGESTPSNDVDASPGAPPSSPRFLKSKSGDRFSFLTWIPPLKNFGFEIINYSIYRGKNIDGLSCVRTIGNLTYFNDTGLENGIKYYYTVTATNEKGEGNRSGIIEVVPGMIPNPPTGLKVSDPSWNSLAISWNANKETDLAGYFLHRSLSKDGSFERINFKLHVKTNYIDTGLEEFTIYYYKLVAVNSYGLESEFSETVSGKTLMAQYPPEINHSISDFSIPEDSYDDQIINLYYWFRDKNNDKLSFRYEGSENIVVNIFQNNGTVTIKPKKDWNGQEKLTFYASDGQDEVFDDVLITVTYVNDPPGPVEIIYPEYGTQIEEENGIDFKGFCNDADIPYGDVLSYIWESNITGEMGKGNQLQDIHLSSGNHEITLTVTDSHGQPSEKSISIIVNRKTEPQKNDDSDRDDDGIPDAWEILHGLSPTDPSDSGKDFDFDGLSNYQEFKIGSDPNDQDTDDDGLNDGFEYNTLKTNVTNADSDFDGHNDGQDASPLDPLNWEKKKSDHEDNGNSVSIVIIFAIVVISVIVIFFFIVKPRFLNKNDPGIQHQNKEETEVINHSSAVQNQFPAQVHDFNNPEKIEDYQNNK